MRNGSKSRACGSPIDWQLHSVGRLLFLIVMRMVSRRLLRWIHRAGLSRVFFERLLLFWVATVTTTVTRQAPPPLQKGESCIHTVTEWRHALRVKIRYPWTQVN